MSTFLAANWPWLLLVGGMFWMHGRGGGCGMHGSHHDHASHDGRYEGDTDSTGQGPSRPAARS